jgi:competence protein ComEA
VSAPTNSDSPAPPRIRLGLGAVVVIVIATLSVTVGLSLLRGQQTPAQFVPVPDATVSAHAGEIYVHVLGAVKLPGIYQLGEGARVVDALAAAGGTDQQADLRAINLARPLADGEQLYVPTQGEAAVASFSPSDGKVNLNTADQAQLETLPRIGPALAARIVQWRETHGRFRSVQDLLAVPGIGEKLLAGIKDLVRI